MKKRFLIFVSVITILAFAGFLLVLFRLDPCSMPGEGVCEKISALNLTLFFLSFFFMLLGVFTLAGFLLRQNIQGEFFYDQMGISLRQGFLLAFIAAISLFLLLFEVLTWWSGLLLLATVLLIELYFTARA